MWGTVDTVLVTEPDALTQACRLIRRELAAVDAAASRFRPDFRAFDDHTNPNRWVPVSELMTALLPAALDAAELTGGAVDPTLGTALRTLGYDRDGADPGTPPVRIGRPEPLT